jgi:gliding motility-associated-like protein
MRFILLLALACLSANALAQVNIKVTVVSVSATLDDCDPGVFGIGNTGSDPNYSWTGSDIDDRCYEFECTNGSNCSVDGTQTISKVLYDQSFACANGMPSSLSWGFRGRENDTPLVSCFPEPPGGSASVQGPIIDVTHTCPLTATLGTTTFSYTETTTGGCAGTMSYTITVEVTGAFPPNVPNLICDAQVLPVDATYRNYAWCGGYTYETGEFDMTTPGWLTDAHGTGWFYFVAPASGSVAIETNTQASSIGTAFIVYHAADGAGCGTGHGISPSGVVLKRKFQYLSSYDDADDDIFLIDPEASANIDMNDCGIFAFADGHDIVAGETYYIQMTTDNNAAAGNIAIRVRDLGGNGSNPSDIPCQAQSAGLLNTSNWSASLSHDCSTNYEFTGNGGTSAYTYLDPTGGTNNINQSNWVSFVAPNSGAAYVEANVPVLGENSALYAYDARFAPGRPNDYSCANLLQTQYAASTSAIFGASASVFSAFCLEPGYNYFVMADPTQIALSGNTNFLLRDPNSAAPANDILCLAMQNAAYNVPIQLLGASPIAPIMGNNTNACIERLAGEPGFLNAADKTVWHYFTAPPSGVVNITVAAGTIGQVAVAVYPALNGSTCYGGLAPATFTNDGTPTTPRLAALGNANGSGNTITQVCCLTPGAKYVIEIDGATTISEGTYFIKAQEVEVRGGMTSYTDTDGDTYTAASPLPALICAGESVVASSNAAILPNGGCLTEGFVLHNQAVLVQPYANLTIYQKATPGNNFFINNGAINNGTAIPPYNTLLYVSALADNGGHWGDRCPSSRIQDAVPVVFLEPIAFQMPTITACGVVTMRVSGGLPAYNASDFTYTISPAGSLTTVASGTVGNNGVITFGGAVAGNYTVFLTDNEGCQRSKTINIPSVSTATATITGANSICGGTTTTLNATGGISYTWTLPNSTTASGASLAANTGGTYTVTVTNALGCTASTTKALTILPAAAVPTILPINPLCAIGNGILDAGAGYNGYVWNTGSPALTTRTITVSAATTYTVTVSTIDGCTATDDITLSTNPNPNAPLITPSALSICGNGFVTLDATNPIYTSYSWSLGASQSPSIAVTTAGDYTVTVTDATGCTATRSTSIVQNPIPITPIITQTAPWCPNSNGMVSIVSPVTGATYVWSNMTSGTTTTAWTSGLLTVTIYGAGNCTNTATINVPSNILPFNLNIQRTDSLCANRPGRITVGSTYASYLWSSGGTQPALNFNTPGTYTITVTNVAGCSNTNSIVITQQPPVALPTFAQANVLCDNRPTTLSANGTGYTDYAWANLFGITANTVQITNATTYTVTVTAANRCTTSASYTPILYNAPAPPSLTPSQYLCATGIGIIKTTALANSYAWSGGAPISTTNLQTINTPGVYTVTITNANTCTNSNSIDIVRAATPAVPNINYETVFCADSPVNLVATAGYASYNWGGTNTTNMLQITTAGAYTVTVTNTFGCSATNSFTAISNPLPTPINIDNPTKLCIGKTSELMATGGYVSYIWSNNTNDQSTIINASDTYTVTITDTKGCKNTSSVTIVQELPTLVSILGNTYYCAGSSLLLQTDNLQPTYIWSNSVTTSVNVVNTDANYTVTATASNGCTGTASISIVEKSLPTANAGSDQTIYLGQTAQLTASGGTTYTWLPNPTLSTLVGSSPIANTAATTIYTVRVKDTFGCESNDDVEITVLDYPDCLKTNEGVTPNGDGKNDTWQIPCLQYFQNTVQIINRWGQTIFTATNYNNDFNGIFEGREQPDGTYYYIVTVFVNNTTKVFKGTITIIR